MINIHNLHKEILEREGKKNKIYEQVYLKAINKIKYTNKYSDSCYCLFQCPNVIYGSPLYDINACIMYIMKKLMDNYFTVQYAEPNLIFISWQNIPRKQVNKNPFKVTAENYLNPNNMLTLHDYRNKKEETNNETLIKKDIFNEIAQEFIRNSSNINRYIEKNTSVFPNMSNNIKNNNSIYNNSSNNNSTNYNSNNNTQNSFNNKQIVLNKLSRDNGPLNLNDVNNYKNNYNNNYNDNYSNNNYNNNYNNSNNFNKDFSFNNNFPTCKTNDNNLQNFNSDIDTILNELDINDGNVNNSNNSSNNDNDSFIGTLL